jgi:ferredoxin
MFGRMARKILVDYSKCASTGMCESFAPDFFEVDDGGDLTVLIEDVPDDRREEVEQAVEGCPTAALRLA